MMKMNLLVIFTVLCYLAGDAVVRSENGKNGPLWIIQMGNRENMQMSPRAMMIPQNNFESGNLYPQMMTGRMLDFTNQILRNSPLPLVELNGHFYYFEKYFKTNFFKALQFCREHGMDLVSIESAEENIHLIVHIKKNYPKIEHFWTSGADLGEEAAFVWLSTGKSLNFTSWGQGAPDNSGKIEHCLEIMKYHTDAYMWNDRACNSEYNFICEIRQ